MRVTRDTCCHGRRASPALATEIHPRSLRLLGVAAPDIDDLLQEVLLTAYESLDRLDPDYPASPSSPPPREADPAGGPPQRDGRRPRDSAEARWLFGIVWRKVSHPWVDRTFFYAIRPSWENDAKASPVPRSLVHRVRSGLGTTALRRFAWGANTP